MYRVYEQRLIKGLVGSPIPHHVGVMLDGNRRWARKAGFDNVAHGHRAGAAHIADLLDWCNESGIGMVTLWLLSTDNLRRDDDRGAATPAGDHHRRGRRTVRAGKALEAAHGRSARPAAGRDGHPADRGRDCAPPTAPACEVNIAVGYGGRQEIVDAVKSMLQEGAEAG